MSKIDQSTEWKLTYEEANKIYKEAPTKAQGKMAIADAQAKKILEYLIANPPEDSYGCVIDDPQYTAMFESMLKELTQ